MNTATRWDDDDEVSRDESRTAFIGTPDADGDESWDGSDPEDRSPTTALFHEPYFRAVAPNFDRVSRRTWEPGTVSRRRAVVALRFLLFAIALVVVLPVAGWLISQL